MPRPLIYLTEIWASGRKTRWNPTLDVDDYRRLLTGEKPSFATQTRGNTFPTLVDTPADCCLRQTSGGLSIRIPYSSGDFPFAEQDRTAYYESVNLQTITFEIARLVVRKLTEGTGDGDAKLRLRSRRQLFPQVYAVVDAYVRRKVRWQDCHPYELGLATYVDRAVERLYDAIEPDDDQGEPPLLPILNRYKPIGSTTEVDFKTTHPCYATIKSHINQVVLDTTTWEQSAAFRMEQSNAVAFYARNDHLEFVIPYEYQGVSHGYAPDYLVRLSNGVTLILEIKGYEDDQDRAKHQAAQRWKGAVNRWGQLGPWDFHVCRNPQMLGRELEWLCRGSTDSL